MLQHWEYVNQFLLNRNVKQSEESKASVAEMEKCVREEVEKEVARKKKIVELEERKVKAEQYFHAEKGIRLNNIRTILLKRMTKEDEEAVENELEGIRIAGNERDAKFAECNGEIRSL